MAGIYISQDPQINKDDRTSWAAERAGKEEGVSAPLFVLHCGAHLTCTVFGALSILEMGPGNPLSQMRKARVREAQPLTHRPTLGASPLGGHPAGRLQGPPSDLCPIPVPYLPIKPLKGSRSSAFESWPKLAESSL